MIPRINHSRTQLLSHLNSYDNGAYSPFVSRDVYPELFDIQHGDISATAPHGWKAAPKAPMRYLWFPGLSDVDVAGIEDWRARFSSYVLLGLNPHLEDHFTDELDFCMALDFNYDAAAGKRTLYGEAEYLPKYKGSRRHFQALENALLEAIPELPIPAHYRDSYCLSCVPAPPGQSTVPRRLATVIAKKLSLDFVDAELHCPKAALKGVAVEAKIPLWQDLYAQGCVVLTNPVTGRLVVIIDDLYQSGVTMWAFAGFLKSQGAINVLGLPCVKSLRDTDNQ